LPLHPLDNRRRAHSRADAKRDERCCLPRSFEFVKRGSKQHGAGRAEWMAHRDRAAGTDRDRAEPVPGESPVDRIRTIMHEARNYFPELEDAAETFAAELALAGNGLM
jgi:hypothetical protein